jgi:AcrR family transcriptional regulator
MSTSHPGRRPRGAARSEAARVAVLKAAASQFATRGYEHLTIEGIAAEAGVAKQTIYRWWPSKSAVVAETLIEGKLLPGQPELPETGDARADLTAWLDQLFRFVEEPANNALVRSLVAVAAENESVGERLNDALGATSILTERIERARAAGELSPQVPVQEVVSALVGAVVVHALGRITTAPGVAQQLIGALLH